MYKLCVDIVVLARYICIPKYIYFSIYNLHNRDITIIHLLIKSMFITDYIYGHHTDFVRTVTILIFTTFYFTLDIFNVLNILLI